MKKIIILTSLLLSTLILQGCSFKDKFYILNWGEYINEDLIDAFEEEFNVKVVSRELISNELMYSELKQGQSYDIVFPSDYMVEKLSNENLIQKLDFNLIKNFTGNSMYTDKLDTLIDNSGYDEYFVPYFWGSLGIMYNTDDSKNKEVVERLGWEVFFDEDTLKNFNVAMYDSSRDSFAAAAMYLQDTNQDTTISINNYTTSQLNTCADLLKASKYELWGDDNIKGRIADGNIDIGLVYSGDFFDQLYSDDYENVNYDIYIPNTNNIFFDAMCIPSNSENTQLAHEFINFMMDFDNSVENALEVGYCPTIQNVFDEIIEDQDMFNIIKYEAWNPQNITNGLVYKDLGSTYAEMESLFTKLRVG